MLKRTSFVLTFLLALVVAAPRASAKPEPWRKLWEHWYVLEIGGSSAGWVRETVSQAGKRYRTEAFTSMKISRGPIEIEVDLSSTFDETREAHPLQLRFVQNMSKQTVDTVWKFEPDQVVATTTQGGRTSETVMDPPEEEWYTPMAARDYWESRREAGAAEITYRTIDAQGGLTPIEFTYVLVGDTEYEFEGRTLPATQWTSTNSLLPGIESKVVLSSDRHVLYEETVMPFGRMVRRIATEAEAKAAGAGPAPELMVSTFVRADKPIARARETTGATFRLRTREGAMPELPAVGAQRVEAGTDAGEAVVRVDVRDPLPATLDTDERLELLASSSMVDAQDALVVKLAARACREVGEDRAARAEAIRRFVHEHISKKSLDTAFATSSETARTRTGDCSEHGVLLCAMLRADGIPARIATGLIYADAFAGEQDIFGWHMWTQAYVDGRWIDLDATLERPYDAAHVLTGVSSMGEGAGVAEMASVMMLLGNLEIEVLDVEHDGG